MDEFPHHNCVEKARFEALEQKVRELGREHKEFFDRLRQLEIDRATIKEQYKNIESSLEDMKDTLLDIQAKPAKRIDAVVTAIIGVVVGFLLKSIGIF